MKALYFIAVATITVNLSSACKAPAGASLIKAQAPVATSATPGALSTVQLPKCTGTLVRFPELATGASDVFVVTAAHCVIHGPGTSLQGWGNLFSIGFPLAAATAAGGAPDSTRAAQLLGYHELYSGRPDAGGPFIGDDNGDGPDAGGPFIWDDNGDGRLDVTKGNVHDVAILKLLSTLPGAPAPKSLLPPAYVSTVIAASNDDPVPGQVLIGMGFGMGGAVAPDGTVGPTTIIPNVGEISDGSLKAVVLKVETNAPESSYRRVKHKKGDPGDGDRFVFRSQAGKTANTQNFLCRGDSGGPAFVQDGRGQISLYGIASFGTDKIKQKTGAPTGVALTTDIPPDLASAFDPAPPAADPTAAPKDKSPQTEYDCARGIVFHAYAPHYRNWFLNTILAKGGGALAVPGQTGP